ncbi:MAG: hypothetical protein K0S32_3555 [Bacteroidetes bacterium]|nr:hypothetical protein [Bacteroidota bacterium]
MEKKSLRWCIVSPMNSDETVRSVRKKPIRKLQQSILDKNTGLLSMYLKEHAEFKNKLYIDNPVPAPLWKKLEELIEEGKNLN